MKKKKKDPVVVWSVDQEYNEFDTRIPVPLYEVWQERYHLVIMYHGVCAIRTVADLDEAKAYIRKALDPFREARKARKNKRGFERIRKYD